jgi:hypothetical protein
MAVYASKARYSIKLKTSPNWDEMASLRDEKKHNRHLFLCSELRIIKGDFENTSSIV